MGKSPEWGNWLLNWKQKEGRAKQKKILIATIAMAVMAGSFFRLDRLQPQQYAYAYAENIDAQKASVKDSIQNAQAQVFSKSEQEDGQCFEKNEGPKDASSANEDGFEQELYDVVGNAPIKEMVPFIAEKDKRVAALIIGIAKKESNWGKASPSKSGTTCYNYWGYKGAGSRGMAMGYGCFADPEEAVDAIGGRIGELVDKNLNTPSRMVVWKCGSSCAGHDPQAVRKWVSDVDIYYKKLVTVDG